MAHISFDLKSSRLTLTLKSGVEETTEEESTEFTILFQIAQCYNSTTLCKDHFKNKNVLLKLVSFLKKHHRKVNTK